MDVNGKWVGFGLGDVSPTIATYKQDLVKKFSYASVLQESLSAGGTAAQTFDVAMLAVVNQMQAAYLNDAATIQNSELVASGILNYAWQIRSGLVAPPKITLLTWQGTGVSMWDTDSPQPYGGALYVAQNCSNVVVQPVGNYPASVGPLIGGGPAMGTSVQMGVDSGVSLLGGAPPISAGDPVYATGPIGLWGYSQGAICSSHLWRDEVLSPTGRLHNRLSDVIAHVTFGNPCRSPGVANGNANDKSGLYGPSPLRDGQVTGGISGPDCLTAAQTPSWQYDYIWLGLDNGATELYTGAPIGSNPWTAEAGQGWIGTLVYNAIQKGTFTSVVEVAEALGKPVDMIEEIWNGITFAAKGPNADHFDYNWLPAIEYLSNVCNQWTNNYINSGGGTQA